MLPIRDSVRRRRFPVVNTLLILANLAVFYWEWRGAAEALIERFALVPAALDPITLVTSQFLHGSFLHVGSNMLYLWIFGDNVEDRLGRWTYLIFYLACGGAGGLAHTYMNPASAVPTIGASGAVAGILGAYLVAFPRARVLTLIPLGFFVPAFQVPAPVYLGIWFLLQLLNGLSVTAPLQPVAWWAHVGGFACGALGLLLLRRGR